MMYLIVKNLRRKFESAKFKHKLYHFDKTDIDNFKFPGFMDHIKDDDLFKVIEKLILKYKHYNYKELYREELEDHHEWSDMEFLFLLKFYERGWSIEIPHEEDFSLFGSLRTILNHLKKRCLKSSLMHMIN